MLRRSPVIFWLLLAATIAVNAVVFSRVASETFPAPFYLKIGFDALIVSQLNVICIWSVLSSKQIRWLPALLAPVAAAFIPPIFSDDPVNFVDEFKLYVAAYGLEASVLVVALWIFRGTRYWRRHTGVAHEWKYSVAQLLVAMTVMAVLTMAMRGSPFFFGDTQLLSIAFTSSFAILAIWSVFAWSTSLHWLTRLAAVVGLALVFGGLFWLAADFGPVISLALASHFVIQAIVLSAWLGLGQILPINEVSLAEPTLPMPPAS
jgi:hypothetical protein